MQRRMRLIGDAMALPSCLAQRSDFYSQGLSGNAAFQNL